VSIQPSADHDHSVDTTRRRPGRAKQFTEALPGLGASLLLALVAGGLGHFAPVVSAPVIAVIGGVLLSVLRSPAPSLRPGLAVSSRGVLQGSVVVLGTALSFREVVVTGAGSLPVMLGTLAVALIGATVIGRALSVGHDLRTLIGVGTGICGASAIAATDAVIEADQADVSYSIATIFTFNVIAVLTFPSIGHALHLSPHAFGLLAGTAVNDMSSVVAASSIFGHGASSTAVVVKLTRTLMIVPITICLALWRTRRGGTADGRVGHRSVQAHIRAVVPGFVIWFLLAVTVNSLGLIPGWWHRWLIDLAQGMIVMALAGIGLSTRARDIQGAGRRPLALGGLLWVLVAGTSLGLQSAMGVAR
jgi:uncharacterized integral membrane protein (TIGR00698 family)